MQERREDTSSDIERLRLERLETIDDIGSARTHAQLWGPFGRDVEFSERQKALEGVSKAQQRAREQTQRLLRLFDRSNNLRLIIRGFNEFSIALIQGAIAPGQENFSQLLIGRVSESSYFSYLERDALELYLSLSYGDPEKERTISFISTKRYGLLPKIIAAIEQDALEKARRERQGLSKRYWDNYHKTERELLAKQNERTQSTRFDVSRWKILTEDTFGRVFSSFVPADQVERMVTCYVPLLAYQSVQEILNP